MPAAPDGSGRSRTRNCCLPLANYVTNVRPPSGVEREPETTASQAGKKDVGDPMIETNLIDINDALAWGRGEMRLQVRLPNGTSSAMTVMEYRREYEMQERLRAHRGRSARVQNRELERDKR